MSAPAAREGVGRADPGIVRTVGPVSKRKPACSTRRPGRRAVVAARRRRRRGPGRRGGTRPTGRRGRRRRRRRASSPLPPRAPGADEPARGASRAAWREVGAGRARRAACGRRGGRCSLSTCVERRRASTMHGLQAGDVAVVEVGGPTRGQEPAVAAGPVGRRGGDGEQQRRLALAQVVADGLAGACRRRRRRRARRRAAGTPRRAAAPKADERPASSSRRPASAAPSCSGRSTVYCPTCSVATRRGLRPVAAPRPCRRESRYWPTQSSIAQLVEDARRPAGAEREQHVGVHEGEVADEDRRRRRRSGGPRRATLPSCARSLETAVHRRAAAPRVASRP